VRDGAVEGLAEVFRVDAAREAVGVGVTVFLGFVQARAAGEDQVGDVEQGRFALQQLLRRVLESGQFVHAVVDDQGRIEVLQQRQRHRGVEPHHWTFAFRHQVGQQALHGRQLVVVEAPGVLDRGMRAAHRDVRRDGRLLQVCLALAMHRFLDEQDIVVFRQARHQVLGALEDEVPAEVAKHDQGRHVDFLSPLRRFS
jgi:hypothetical protein